MPKAYAPPTLVLCACGCGDTRPRFDPRGRPRRYIKGHERRRYGEDHPRWKGEDVSYTELHAWLSRHYSKTECEECGSEEQLEWANISGDYRRDRTDYRVLCRSCHRRFDGGVANFGR